MKRHVLLTALIAGSFAFGAGALAQPKDTGKDQPKKDTQPSTEKKMDKKDSKAPEHAKLGDKAPEFSLTDLDGKTWTLSELTKQKKVVVLEWYNPECPYSGKKHYQNHQTMNDTAAAYKDKNVVFLSVNSGAADKTGNKADNQKKAKEYKINHPVLLDTTTKVAAAYQAKNTPTMYIIGADGTLVYWGAIDDDSSAENVGKVNYVKKALDEVLAGQTVTTAQTKPYGCHVESSEKGADTSVRLDV
jgi:peroxiredoxin